MSTRLSELGSTIRQMALMGLRYLSGRRLRTALTTLAIVFGVALIFAINLVLPSAIEAFQQTMTGIGGADLTMTSATGEAFASDAVVERLAAIDGVRAAAGVLRRQFALPTLGLKSENGSVPQIELVGLDPTSAGEVREFIVSEGRFLQPGDTGKAVLPAGLVDLAPQLQVGTTFPLVTAGGLKLYTIVGLLAEQGSVDTPQIYVTLPDAQAAFNQPGLINTVEVSVKAGADRAAVEADIQQALGDSYTLNTDSSATDTVAAMQIGFAMMDLLGVLALFLGAFLIFNTFRTVVVERRRDLAMLRAIGATRRQITLMIVIESLIQGILGTIIGLLLGYLMAFGVVSFMDRFWATYLNRGALTLQLNAPAVLGAVVLGLVTALIAGYLPARAAGKVTPLDGLRPASATSQHRVARWSLIVGAGCMVFAVLLLLTGSKGAVGGAFLFLIGMVLAAPGLVVPMARLFSPLLTLWYAREGDLARGNLVRQPGRAAITGSTLMIGLATLVTMAAIVAAFGGLINALADANFGSDLILLPPSIALYDTVVGADETLAAKLRALPEVETVGSLRYASATTGGQSLQVMGIDPNEYPEVATFEFSQGEPDEVYAALDSGRNAIVSSMALASLNLSVGSDVVLQTPAGPQTYHIAGVANDLFTFKLAVIFISQANVAADFHKTEDILLMLNLTPEADHAAALAKVQNILADYPQFTARLTGEYRAEIVGVSTSAMNLFYALAFLILLPAALGLLNTLTINILERTREIGVVRAVGGSRKQVRRIVTAEALLLGIFGAAMGVLAGVAMSYGFIAAFATVGWDMPYQFPLLGVIAAIVIGVLLALFASILPARSAARLDIIHALQYE